MRRLVFEKKADSVWISHLDLMRIFQRAFRRAGVMLKHSQGFTPRAIVSIALPLSVGTQSECELLEFETEEDVPLTCEMLNEKLPEGIRVLDIAESSRKIRELAYLRAELTLDYDNGITEEQTAQIEQLFQRQQLTVEKHGKKGTVETDLIPMLKQCSIVRASENAVKLEVLVCAQNPSLNPQLLVQALEAYLPELAPDDYDILRKEVYDAKMEIFR